MKKVLCIGSVTTDVIVNPADSVPPAGTLRAVDSVTTHVGGCASNAAIDLAKLGVPVALSCKVGSDSFGEFVRGTAAAAGVDVRGVVSDPGVSTTVSIVCVGSSGERSFLYCPGSTSAFQKEDLQEEVWSDCDIIFVAGAMLLSSFDGKSCAAFFREMRAAGKFTVMDTAWDFEDKWLPKIAEAIPCLDLFMPSYDEAVKLSGKKELSEIADFFFEIVAGSVVIKTGADGAYICESREKRYSLPTYRTVKPKDTTGAGDSFCAGFLAGLAQGWSYEESGRFANAVGTHCIMEIGASTGIRSIAEILSFMERTPLD